MKTAGVFHQEGSRFASGGPWGVFGLQTRLPILEWEGATIRSSRQPVTAKGVNQNA